MLNSILLQVEPVLKRIATFGKVGLFLVLFAYILFSLFLRWSGLNEHNELIDVAGPWMFGMAIAGVAGDLVASMIRVHLRQGARRAG